MNRRRAVGPIVGGFVMVLLFLGILLAPAVIGRSVKEVFHDLPQPVRDAIPNNIEHALGRSVDDAVQFFGFGNPDVLIQGDLRAFEANPPPGTWSPVASVNLAWTDLGSDKIQYEVRHGPPGSAFGSATLSLVANEPMARVDLPNDGAYMIYVQPRTEAKRGHVSAFGPFLVDGTPPTAPALEPRGDPPGYRFQINWTGSTDVSGILGYDVERSLNGGAFLPIGRFTGTTMLEDQVGNGLYAYRVRAVNGAGLRSLASNPIQVIVRAPMQNPGDGQWTYGVHANYTGFLYLWDLSNMDTYASIDDVPQDVKSQYLGGGFGIEIENETLRQIVRDTVGSERNAAKIAEKLFIYLFDRTDYDAAKLSAGGNLPLQRAGETLDRGKGICGDLAVLYLTLLRIAGVPARPIHGYLDNALAGVGGFHMWVEVYVGPANSQRPWMTVDVSGVTGDPTGDHKYKPEYLYAYFGIFNPDYLALGIEQDYIDNSWNTWARFTYTNPQSGPQPQISDKTQVSEDASEEGCLYFNTNTRQTKYVKETANGGCPSEPGFTNFYKDIKGVSRKRIDYGADVASSPGLPTCLAIKLRYPMADEFSAINSDQSVIYRLYEHSDSVRVKVGTPQSDGWVKFTDGTGSNCNL